MTDTALSNAFPAAGARPSRSAIAIPPPLHTQIRDALRSWILDGTYPPHHRMPSESELGEQFSASRITVRHALGDLQKEGLIFRVHGKGTFVSKPRAFQNVTSLQGFAEAMSSMGHEILNQVRSSKVVPASRAIATQLRLQEGDMVVEIRRVRLLNREPISLELTWVPEAIGRRLLTADLVTRDIFVILENDCGVKLGHADLSVDAILADEELTRALRIQDSAPVLRIERLTHDAEGMPLDYEFLYFRGDAFQYRLRVDRQRAPTATAAETARRTAGRAEV
ncbi:GntR family transcriptional regulator [Cupriavidus sp. AcVe19-6a]|uniref:GntR family transcriptional regulator n=1 Tax=Cupriavidus sp. AcVe19-6a TaxID=2821358 RepID=UPI001AE31C61|nr:GntR family transcriptional regulator [Cupriavidus sp. AcVe19-6a]MBP0639108.1 GntR family transcriptional regulator [Cupriavidus sp. AcVe19-6a]